MRQPTGIRPGAPDRLPLYVRSAGDEVLISMVAVGPAPGDRRPIRLAVSGVLDFRTAAGLCDVLVGLLRRYRPVSVELDLSGVTRLDGAGAREVQRFAAVAAGVNAVVAVREPPGGAAVALRSTGLPGIVTGYAGGRRPPDRPRNGKAAGPVRVAHRPAASRPVATKTSGRC